MFFNEDDGTMPVAAPMTDDAAMPADHDEAAETHHDAPVEMPSAAPEHQAEESHDEAAV
jgi:hypothetical protein